MTTDSSIETGVDDSEPIQFDTGLPADDDTAITHGAPAGFGVDIDVPEELQFSTEVADREDRAVERIPLKLDGQVFYLYRPSDAVLYLMGGTLAEGSDDIERINAMMQLIQVSLDAAGSVYLRRKMLDRRNKFDDELLGKIVGVIMRKWAGGTMEEKFAATQSAADMNRAQKRAAAKAKPAAATKAPAKAREK